MDRAPPGPFHGHKGGNRLDHQRAEKQPPEHRVGPRGPGRNHQYPFHAVCALWGKQTDEHVFTQMS